MWGVKAVRMWLGTQGWCAESKICQVGMSKRFCRTALGSADTGNHKIVVELISMVIQFSQEFLAAREEEESTQMTGLIW